MSNEIIKFSEEIKKTLFVLLLLIFVFISNSLAGTSKLPDTGQTACYDGSGDVITCPAPGQSLAQDGSYTINPMSFTDDGTVTDNNTGLIWQKLDNGNTYNWYQASGTYDASYNPTSQNVCGSLGAGWRLPSQKELMSIVDYSIPYPGPTINSLYFPNTKSSYWSSTTIADNPSYAWVLLFTLGKSGGAYKNGSSTPSSYVRCVSGGQYPSQSLTDNGNGTVSDNATVLMWQQDEPGYMTWETALSYCEGLNLGGYSDWRLPNIKELASLTDDMRYNPSIDTTFFPNAYVSGYLTSTTGAGSPLYAWYVYFGNGSFDYNINKNSSFYVRCVRGGGAPPPPPSWAYPVLPYTPGSYAGRYFFYHQDHLGEDIALPVKTPINAIGPGVIKYYAKASGYGELVAVVEHDLGEPYEFTNAYGQKVTTRYVLSIYGHLRRCMNRRDHSTCTVLKIGDSVTAEIIVGYVNDDAHNGDGAEHLHMGIRLSDAATAKLRDPKAWFRGYERRTTFGTDFAAASEVIAILMGQ